MPFLQLGAVPTDAGYDFDTCGVNRRIQRSRFEDRRPQRSASAILAATANNRGTS